MFMFKQLLIVFFFQTRIRSLSSWRLKILKTVTYRQLNRFFFFTAMFLVMPDPFIVFRFLVFCRTAELKEFFI